MLLNKEIDLKAELNHTVFPAWFQQTLWRCALTAMGVKLEVDGSVAPDVGPAIVAVGHHASHLDSIVMLVALRQLAYKTTALAKQEYFGEPGIKRLSANVLMPAWHGISYTSEGLKHLITLIAAARAQKWQELFMIFPQGTRDNPENQPFFRGVANVARNGEVPIIPAVLVHNEKTLPKGMSIPRGMMHGVERMLTGRQVTLVKFGSALDPAAIVQESRAKSPKDKDRAVMQALVASMMSLYRELGQPVPAYIKASSDV